MMSLLLDWLCYLYTINLGLIFSYFKLIIKKGNNHHILCLRRIIIEYMTHFNIHIPRSHNKNTLSNADIARPCPKEIQILLYLDLVHPSQSISLYCRLETFLRQTASRICRSRILVNLICYERRMDKFISSDTPPNENGETFLA